MVMTKKMSESLCFCFKCTCSTIPLKQILSRDYVLLIKTIDRDRRYCQDRLYPLNIITTDCTDGTLDTDVVILLSLFKAEYITSVHQHYQIFLCFGVFLVLSPSYSEVLPCHSLSGSTS